MPIDWSALPGLPKAFGDATAPAHFGDLAAELAAVASPDETTLILTDMAWIKVSGADACTFLHNQLTSDVSHLEAGHWQHSAWCSAKGRMLATFVLARPDESNSYLLGLPAEILEPVLKRLRMFVLRSKLVLEDLSASIATIAIQGPGTAALLQQASLPVPPQSGIAASAGSAWVVRRSDAQCLVALSKEGLAALSSWSGLARIAGLAAWRLAEVRAGLPVVVAATQDEFVPQMVNFDKVGGVSFHKGCYPGQEVVARTQYLGKVKRHLYRARSMQEIRPGAPLFAGSVSPDASSTCGTVANAAPSPQGGWESLVVVLESAATTRIRVGSPEGPELSNLDLVAA